MASSVKDKSTELPVAKSTSSSSSHESEEPDAGQQQEQDAVTKSFKDLVTNIYSTSVGIV